MRFDDRRRRAEERFAEYLALRKVGQAGDFEVWVREHPDLADELRALRQSWSRVDARIKKAARGLSRSIFGSRGDASKGSPLSHLSRVLEARTQAVCATSADPSRASAAVSASSGHFMRWQARIWAAYPFRPRSRS